LGLVVVWVTGKTSDYRRCITHSMRVIPAALGILVAIGTAIGFLAGRGYQIAHRAWSDYQKTKAVVPELQKAFWAAARAAILIVTVAIVWMAGSVLAAGSAKPSPATPASPAPSRTR
jgi:hypothetical protein